MPAQKAGLRTERRFLFLIASGRSGGNTEALARTAAESLPVEAAQKWLCLSDLALEPFEDIRHEAAHGGVYPMPRGNARHLAEETLRASDIVFVAPVYWYALPAPAKLYLDHWSAWIRVPELAFRTRMKGKTVWALTTVSDADRGMAAALLDSLRLTAEYMSMAWGGSVVARGNRPGDVVADDCAMAAARTLFDTPAVDDPSVPEAPASAP